VSRLPLRAAIAVAATCCALAFAAACGSKDYGETTAGGPDAAEVDTGTDSGTTTPDAVADAGPSACPGRFLPAEGTYSYGAFYAKDDLKINDASVTTQAIKSPFFATIKHEAAGCWTLKAFVADGNDGKHTHSWKFCNACANDASTLDLASEDDVFAINGVTQTSHYDCTQPQTYVLEGLTPDASISHGSCIGQSTGTQQQTIEVDSVGYVYVEDVAFPYLSEDASVQTHHFDSKSQLFLGGSGSEPTPSTTGWWFDVTTGMPMQIVLLEKTQTKIGDGSVDYTFSLVMARETSGVAPYVENP